LAAVKNIHVHGNKIYWTCNNILASIFIHGFGQIEHSLEFSPEDELSTFLIADKINNFSEWGKRFRS
jgi:hypothetical protein